MNGPVSLQNLKDIVMPPPVPFWPPAPGWLFLLGLLILLLVFLLARAVLRYRRNAYRRAALAEIAALSGNSDALPAIAALLKRTALAAFPREQVAGLTGWSWVGWLSDTSGMSVPAAVSDALIQGIYKGAEPADIRALTDFVTQWIHSHRRGT